MGEDETSTVSQLQQVLSNCLANLYKEKTMLVLCSALCALTNITFDSDNNKQAVIKFALKPIMSLVDMFAHNDTAAFFITMLLRNLVTCGPFEVMHPLP